MLACPHCGSPAEEGKVFCTGCGAPVTPTVASPSPFKGTMIGFSPPAASQPAPAPAPAPAFDPRGTMLGMASPFAAAPAPVAAPRPPAKHTMLGVAIPGVAPLQAGAPPAAPAAPAPVPAAPPPSPSFEPAPPAWDSPGLRPPSAPKSTPRSPALVALAAGGVLALGAIAFALLWKSPPPLTAQPREDAEGHDILHLVCASCADGTQARVDGVSATFSRGEADVPLAKGLGVGENRLSVELDRPGSGRDETVPLVVPVAYRVRADLSGLEASPPSVRIVVEAQQGASVAIDGKPVALGPDGRALYAFDVSAQCTGSSDEATTIERSVPYSVTPRGGTKGEGAVGVRVGVPPLHLDAPGSAPIVESESLLVAGRTSRGGSVTVGGKPAQVSADGAFTFDAKVPPGGSDLEIRARAPGLAPRTARVQVERVASLAAEGRSYAAKAPLTFADLVANVAKHVGEPLVVAGEVAESRTANHQTITLLDARPCAKTSCFVRVVAPGGGALARGAQVRVYGRVTRELPGASPVPEMEASFILPGR